MNNRWLAIVVLIIVVLGATYAIYKRNTESIADNNTSNSTTSTIEPAAGPVSPTDNTSPTAMAPGSPFDVSNTVSGTTDMSGSMVPTTAQ